MRDKRERRHRRTTMNAECVAMMAQADFDAAPSLSAAMGLNLDMESDRDGITESGRNVASGTTVRYVAHVSGGMIRVVLPDGELHVMHPHCFPGLRG